MPGVPSNKACERCKKRHLKCDETRPKCQRCTSARVECPGYIQTRKFIDQGATVRRRYAPYSNDNSRSNADISNRKTNSPSDSRQNASQQAMDFLTTGNELPVTEPSIEGAQNGTYSQVVPSIQSMQGSLGNNPIQTGSGDIENQQGTTAASNFSTIQNSTNRQVSNQIGHTERFQREKEQSGSSTISRSPNGVTGGYPNTLSTPHSIETSQISPVSRFSSSGEMSQRSEKEELQDIFSELMTGTEHEIAFLTRHFLEVLGPWLDLSDSGKFFTGYVPIRAINSDFLKYAIAALVSKHLGRVKGTKTAADSEMFTNPATMEVYPNASRVDWFLKAANYYYLAVSNLNRSISDHYSTVSSSTILESPIETVSRWLNLQRRSPGENLDPVAFLRKVEDLLAASALLTLYKLLDERGEHWQTHLRGIKSLFDSILELKVTQSVHDQFSHGISAVFWNFARQDYLASYFNRLPTHLDQDNLPLWRAAGIPIDDEGNVSPASVSIPANRIQSQHELAANSLIWIMNKVVNFLADFKRAQISQWMDMSPDNTPDSPEKSSPTSATWIKLCVGFQSWFDSVPETFRPCLRLEHPKDMSKPPDARNLPFPEISYSLPSCTLSAQQYHFGRLALLLNRPPDIVSAPSTAFDRLQGYLEVTKEVDHRCREICGIALGRPQGGVRIYMIPLLLAVGQCLETDEERQIIVDLLRGVEADLGWVTEDTVQTLQSFWNQPSWI